MIVTKKFNPSDLDEKSEDGNDQKMNWKEKIELFIRRMTDSFQ